MRLRIVAPALLIAIGCGKSDPNKNATPSHLPTETAAAPGTFHVTIDVRTGEGEGDGADRHAVEICLTETWCAPIDVDNADVLRPGKTDVLHFESMPVPPSSFDRVVLRSKGSDDTWRPSCISIAIEGEIIHCEGDLAVSLGTESDDVVASWRDPAGIHVACGSCADEPLTHGPVVGATEPDGAKLWVRTDLTRDVAVLVHDDDDPGAPVIRVEGRTEAADDYTATLHVPGLAPAHRYRADFEVSGELASRSATFHTPPSPDTKGTLKLAYGSCARVPPQSIFDVVARENADLFVFGGDNTYADSPKTAVHWAHLRAGLEHRARADLLAKTTSIAVWDDHDFVGNDSNGTWKGKGDALRAFQDYFANVSYGTAEAPGVFHAYTWGDVEIFMLDVRTYRSPDAAFDGTMLGKAQEKWLEEQLLASTATFKLLVSGSVWDRSAGETWLDHPEAREKLFDFLTYQRIPGVVLLGGDLHRSMLRRIHRPEAYVLPEIVSSPLAVPRTWKCPEPERGEDRLACFDDGNAVAMLSFDTKAADPKLEVRLLDEGAKEVGRMDVLRSQLQ